MQQTKEQRFQAYEQASKQAGAGRKFAPGNPLITPGYDQWLDSQAQIFTMKMRQSHPWRLEQYYCTDTFSLHASAPASKVLKVNNFILHIMN